MFHQTPTIEIDFLFEQRTTPYIDDEISVIYSRCYTFAWDIISHGFIFPHIRQLHPYILSEDIIVDGSASLIDHLQVPFSHILYITLVYDIIVGVPLFRGVGRRLLFEFHRFEDGIRNRNSYIPIIIRGVECFAEML